MPLTLKEKLEAITKLLFEPKVVTKLISFRSYGYFLDTGWFNSFKSGESVNAKFNPIPWFTYPAIDFLHERLNKNLRVLEFGSGNSTLFLAERVKEVLSYEHNRDWLAKISLKKPDSVKLKNTSAASPDEYLFGLSNEEKFEIIIVDGLFRNECLLKSLPHLSGNGVIILDDSERVEYNPGINFLIENNFKQISFSGIAPGIFFRKCTSFFYKSENCLGI
jgi:hypothetical protein